MAWTDIFGGQTVNPQDLSYKTYSFAANTTLLWDNTTAESDRVVADIMDIAATVAGVVVSMPDARQAGAGAASLIFNAGAESFDVVSATGVAIVTLAPGEAWYVWLRDNTTQSGLWRAIEFGAGTSVVSAASLASATVKASGAALVQAMPVFNINSDYTAGAGERGNLILWTGGVGTLTLSLAGTVGADWFAAVRNGGSGTLTIARSGSDLIDGAASFTLNPAESATLVCDGTNYFTAAKSLTPTNTFTLLSIDVAGTGDFTLSAGQLGFASYIFTGLLTGNRSIIVPDTVAPYRVRNATTGSFTLTVKTAAGTGVAVDQANGKFLVCDGTNVFDQVTPGIATPIAVADGGTGATTASGARTNLGATTVGNALFTAADAAAGRTTLDVPANARAINTGTGLTGGGDLSADRTLSIAAGGVGTTQLADSGVTTAKIGDNQVTTAKIGDNQVTDAKLAPQARADVASATTTNIGAATTQYVRITGTTTITGLGTAAAGVERELLFADVLTLTHNATSLINITGDDILTAAGDTARFRSEGSGNWRMMSYARAGAAAASKLIGEPFFLFDNITGVSAPDNSGSAKYIRLTAGQSGAGGYNEGLLTSESVSGSAPLVEATAEIVGGPLNGQTVHLINTEEAFIRARETSGALQMDQMQRITGTQQTDREFYETSGSGSLTSIAGPRSNRASAGSSQSSTLQFNSANSPDARASSTTAGETRSKNLSATAYMRIA